MSVRRRAFADAVPIKLSDLPRFGIEPSLIAALARESGPGGAGNAIGGIDPDWDDMSAPRHAAGPFHYDWSDADERDGSR